MESFLQDAASPAGEWPCSALQLSQDRVVANPEIPDTTDLNQINPRVFSILTEDPFPEIPHDLEAPAGNSVTDLQQPHEVFDNLFQAGSFPDDLKAMRHIESALDVYSDHRVHDRPPILGVPKDYRQGSQAQDAQRHFMDIRGLAEWIEDPWGDLETVGQGSISRERTRIRSNGFRPTEVMASGTLSCSPLRLNDLSYPVHRIFRFENFVNCAPRIYEELAPALRLASIWLTHPACRSFFMTILFGKRTIDAEETLERKCMTTRVERFDAPRSDQLEAIFNRYMNQLADHSSFEFDRDIWPESENGLRAYGCTEIFDSFPGIFVGDDVRPWSEPAKFYLMHDFYTQAHKFAAMKYPDEASKLRFYFFFAVNICHEVAHGIETRGRAVHFLQLRKNLGIQGLYHFFKTLHGQLGTDNACDVSMEALFEDQSISETGEAWEYDFFGGRLQTVNGAAAASDGIFFLPQSQNHVEFGKKYYTVPMGYIEELQQQSFWNHFQGLDVPRGHFRIPEVGAVAFNCPINSTLSFRAWINNREQQESGALDIDMVDTPAEPSSGKVQSRFMPGTLSLITDIDWLNMRALCPDSAVSDTTLCHAQDLDMELERGQKCLFEYDIVPSSPMTESESEENEDIARKDPISLTTADKWALAEEYYCRANRCCSLQFLEFRAHRELHFDGTLDPENDYSWSKEQIDLLLGLRRDQGEDVNHEALHRHEDPDKDDEKAYPHKFLVAKKWQLYEELAVYNGYFRLDVYKERSSFQINFLNQSPNIYPPNLESWGPAEIICLEEKRQEFQTITSKWTLLEEYVRIKYRMLRPDFLHCKHNHLLNFTGEAKLNLNPEDPCSWAPLGPEMQALNHLRHEVSRERILEKESHARIAYVLRGIGDWEDFDKARSTGRLQHLVLEPFGCIDPEYAESWGLEATQALNAELGDMELDLGGFDWPDFCLGACAGTVAAAAEEEEGHEEGRKKGIGKQDQKITKFFERLRKKEDGDADGDSVSEISTTLPTSVFTPESVPTPLPGGNEEGED